MKSSLTKLLKLFSIVHLSFLIKGPVKAVSIAVWIWAPVANAAEPLLTAAVTGVNVFAVEPDEVKVELETVLL